MTFCPLGGTWSLELLESSHDHIGKDSALPVNRERRAKEKLEVGDI